MPFKDYINEMSMDGTYGDEITLRTITEIFNIEFSVISTLDREGSVIIKPKESIPLARIIVGHLAEGQGIHYVVLQRDGNSTEDEDDFDPLNSERNDTINSEQNDPLN